MNTRVLLTSVLLAVLALASCGRPHADSVIIINKDGTATVMGGSKVTFGFVNGVFQAQLCEDKNVFVFRTDETACGAAGKAGHAYLAQKIRKLKDVGTVDLNKSDTEIAELFGLKNSAPGIRGVPIPRAAFVLWGMRSKLNNSKVGQLGGGLLTYNRKQKVREAHDHEIPLWTQKRWHAPLV